MSEEARSRRASALEEKKRRLEELKARRAAAATTSSVVPSVPEVGLDEYIDDLLSAKAPGTDASPPSAIEQPPESSSPVLEEQQLLQPQQQEPKQQQSDTTLDALSPQLVKTQVEMLSAYTQTEDDYFPINSVPNKENVMPTPTTSDDQQGPTQQPSSTPCEDLKETTVQQHTLLSLEEREAVLQSETFSSFFTRASKKVERILGAPILADLLLDANYAGTSSSVEQDQEEHEKGKLFIKNKWLAPGAHSRIVLECPTWSKTRAIHDIYWSPIHKELLLATYDTLKSAQQSPTIQGGGGASTDTNIDKSILLSKNNNAPSDSLAVRSYEHLADGVALLWSLAMPHRPEHILISNSPILCARFHPTEPHLIIGGCYSGQLMLWDLRTGRLPIQKSTLAISTTDKNTTTWKGHAHPLCAMEVVEGGSALVTASTDGKVNFWSLSNLRDPAESYVMEGNVSCLAVAPESNSILCGDERGGMHSITVPQSAPVAVTPSLAAAPSAGVVTAVSASTRAATSAKSSSFASSNRRVARKLDVSAAIPTGTSSHFGMVTSISTKYVSPTSVNIGGTPSSNRYLSRGFLRGSAGLVLTSGVDWTCKLWAPAYQDPPLLSFTSSSYDYMCDVQWNPSNPTVFAAASSNGVVDFWNLSHSIDEPISGSAGVPVSDPKTQAVNKLRWSYDGRRLGIAVSDQVHVLAASEELWRGRAEDESRMMHHLIARGFMEDQT